MELTNRIPSEVLLSLRRFNLDTLRVRKVLSSLISHFPRFAKYVLFLLLFTNARSLPFAWHFRVFRSVFAIRLRYLGFRLRMLFAPRKQREEEEDKWLDNLCPVGKNPFDTCVSYHTWASFDDSDLNGHLSNSSYAKACDPARVNASLKMYPMIFRAGGYMALASTHFDFIREIPMLAPYEIRVSVGAWDQKWIYVICKFVTKPKRTRSGAAAATPTGGELTPSTGPATPPNITSTVIAANASQTLETMADRLGPRSNPNGVPKQAKVLLEPDGAILHAVAVSKQCFKIGRITVPPSLVLATNGFSEPPIEQDVPYSHTNPPPTWLKAKELASTPYGGSPARLKEFLIYGWREVQGEKWWEEALGRSIEERRKEGIKVMTKLTTGLEDVRV